MVNDLHEEKTDRVIENALLIEAIVPKIRHPEYYTNPHVQGLAARERAEQGFGSIKFKGSTDAIGLDLNSIVKFHDRELLVYEEGKIIKPAIGEGLNTKSLSLLR